VLAAWSSEERDVAVWAQEDEAAYESIVVYASAEGRGAFQPERPTFPTGAGGFDFGLTPKQARAECKRRGGTYGEDKDEGILGFACDKLTVHSPLQIETVG